MRLFIYCLLKKGFPELELGGSFQETMVFSNVKIAHRALQHSQEWTQTEKRNCARCHEKSLCLRNASSSISLGH